MWWRDRCGPGDVARMASVLKEVRPAQRAGSGRGESKADFRVQPGHRVSAASLPHRTDRGRGMRCIDSCADGQISRRGVAIRGWARVPRERAGQGQRLDSAGRIHAQIVVSANNIPPGNITTPRANRAGRRWSIVNVSIAVGIGKRSSGTVMRNVGPDQRRVG